MSRSLWWGSLALAVLVAAIAGYGATRWRIAAGPVFVGQDNTELGEFMPASQVRFDYLVRNEGRSVLELSGFRSSCACLLVGLTKLGDPPFKITVEPGKSAKLPGTLSVSGAPGQAYSTTIGFDTNDPSRPKVEITVGYRVAAGLSCYPREAACGEMLPGAETILPFVVRKPEKLKVGTPTRFAIEPASLGEIVRIPAEDIGEPANLDGLGDAVAAFKLKVKAPETVGPFSGTVSVYSPESGASPAFVLLVQGLVVPFVTVMPETIVLPRMGSGGLIRSATVFVRAHDRRPPRLSFLEPPKDLSLVIGQARDDGSVPLVVTWDDKKAVPGSDEARTVTVSASAGGRETKLPLRIVCRNGG